jgi:hypothetical protein
LTGEAVPVRKHATQDDNMRMPDHAGFVLSVLFRFCLVGLLID